jgi:uncharacterized protein YkwD
MSNVIRGMRRALGAALATAAFAAVGTVPLATPASALVYTPSLTTFDARLLYDINHARASYGLRALVAAPGTTDVAHGWSCHMASSWTLAHNYRLGSALSTHGSRYWTTYGENVGMQPSTYSADAMFRAYWNSAPHRANILSRSYRYIGIWSKPSGSRRWNTIDFVGSTTGSYSSAYGATRYTC